MSIASTLLPEFEHEMATTRRVLEAVPDDKLGWRPHEKAWTLGELATHVAQIPVWTAMTLTTDQLDLEPLEGEGTPPPSEAGSRAELLERLDQHVAAARSTLAEASDETLRGTWALLKGGETKLTLPRSAVLRTFVLNHMIHHRGQLSTYLRVAGAHVPSVYGPTADEPW